MRLWAATGSGRHPGDPLYRRLNLAPVASASGAFKYLAHVQKRAE